MGAPNSLLVPGAIWPRYTPVYTTFVFFNIKLTKQEKTLAALPVNVLNLLDNFFEYLCFAIALTD